MPLGAKTFVIMIVLLSLQQIMCNVCNNNVMYYNERLNQSLNDALNLQTTALYLQTTNISKQLSSECSIGVVKNEEAGEGGGVKLTPDWGWGGGLVVSFYLSKTELVWNLKHILQPSPLFERGSLSLPPSPNYDAQDVHGQKYKPLEIIRPTY